MLEQEGFKISFGSTSFHMSACLPRHPYIPRRGPFYTKDFDDGYRLFNYYEYRILC